MGCCEAFSRSWVMVVISDPLRPLLFVLSLILVWGGGGAQGQ